MATQAKDLCLGFAKASPHVRGLVLLGSFAVQQQTKTSDLDILFVIKPEVIVEEYQRELCDIFQKAVYKGKQGEKYNNEVKDIDSDEIHPDVRENDVGAGVLTSYECDILSEDKTVIYLSCDDGNSSISLKVDCGHATNVMEKAKYIIGSEVKLKHLSNVILLDYFDDENIHIVEKYKREKQVDKGEIADMKGQIHNQLQHALQSKDPYAFTGLKDNDPKYHLNSFVELFESCCCDAEKDDEYRTQFHLFILRHRLLSLELLFKGESEHIYLPKMVHKRVRIIGIETTNVYHSLIRMLIQFQSLHVESLDEMFQQKFKTWCFFLQVRLCRSYSEYEKTGDTFQTLYDSIKERMKDDNIS